MARFEIFENDSTVANGPTTLAADYMGSCHSFDGVLAFVAAAEGNVPLTVSKVGDDRHIYICGYKAPSYVVCDSTPGEPFA